MTTIKLTKQQIDDLLQIDNTEKIMRITSLNIHVPNDPLTNDFIVNYEIEELKPNVD